MTIRYSETDVVHLEESQLVIVRWNEERNEWVELPITVNTEENRATAQTSQSGLFDLQAPLLCVKDTLEPDDHIDIATTIDPDQDSLTKWVVTGKDHDWFKFRTGSGSIYTLNVQKESKDVKVLLELFDTDGVSLLMSVQDDVDGSELEVTLDWFAPQSQTYFVRISRLEQGLFGCDAEYEFSMTSRGSFLLPLIRK